ncbi:L-threonylcarbamoyladenylate synthase [Ferruginibacter paludis]|uniref:L-threonylcarbamoyladenylate synthase n=1 Tax=Ferruginibacter paludis TaxID=1310417 RepID=UPI0025B3A8F9|nr:L-threonylcarbamoyladenylate synthase [Ferruginibacter paludis]MDN3655593.1 L-threonylcarbamoyladenylate synthase [Ferruginibacter paludis]
MIDFSSDISNCITVMQNGGIILYPTDTIWGIGCDATNEEAVAKIFALKKRAEEKSMIILLAEDKDIIQYITQPDLAVIDYLQTVTKPTTVIYEGATGLAENVISSDGSVAIRITRDPFCRHLIKRFKKPVVSTSANVSGFPSPATFAAISDEIKNGVDYIVQHRQDDLLAAAPSAIIKWNKDATVTVLRS